MKTLCLLLFSLLGILVFGQDQVEKPFKTSTNKYYIGANVSPIFVATLNAENFRPEWKFAYKQRLGNRNHFFRLSYSVLRIKYDYGLYWFYSGYDATYTIPINSTMDWRTGTYKNKNNNQNFKFGYEYQFKVGEARKASINLGADFLLGFNGGKIFSVNDTITYRTVVVGGINNREIIDYKSNEEVLKGERFYYGFSPMLGVGIPLKKRFDLTLEMAFDITRFNPNTTAPFYQIIDVQYRPSFMLSYRFDEKAVARSKAQERR